MMGMTNDRSLPDTTEKKVGKMKKIYTLSILFLAASASYSFATVIPYYDVPPAITINGALIDEAGGSTGQGSGHGAFDPFLRVHLTGQGDLERGYNTDAPNPLEFETIFDSQQHTHSVLISDLEIMTINSIDYYQLVLDLQEPNPEDKITLTLHTLEIWEHDIADDNVYADGLGTLKWSLDGGSEGDVALNLRDLYAGQGQYDYKFYIPTSIGLTNTYFYLYNEFGVSSAYNPDFMGYPAEGAFEEWKYAEAASEVPEPATMLLFGTGLAGLAGARRRKKQR